MKCRNSQIPAIEWRQKKKTPCNVKKNGDIHAGLRLRPRAKLLFMVVVRYLNVQSTFSVIVARIKPLLEVFQSFDALNDTVSLLG